MSIAQLHAELGTAVASNVKASVVKRVVESYAACAADMAKVIELKHDVEPAELSAAVKFYKQSLAALAATEQDVLAVKWLPP